MSEGCDPEIYSRINGLERMADRHDERIKTMDDSMREIKPEIKKLQRMSWQSEIRLGVLMAAAIWAVNHFFNK